MPGVEPNRKRVFPIYIPLTKLFCAALCIRACSVKPRIPLCKNPAIFADREGMLVLIMNAIRKSIPAVVVLVLVHILGAHPLHEGARLVERVHVLSVVGVVVYRK